MPNKGVPDKAYMDKVTEAVKDMPKFSDDKTGDLAESLALSCFRHDWPLPGSYFKEDVAAFSDDDKTKIDDFLIKLEEFAIHDDEDDDDKDDDDPDKKTTKSQEGDMTFSEPVLTALGLSKTSSAIDAVAAIAALKTSAFTESEKSEFTVMQKDYAVRAYMEQIRDYVAVPGTLVEKGDKLYDLSTKISPEAATEQIAMWKTYQEAADTAGITKVLLDTREDHTKEGVVEAEIAKYAEDHKIDKNVALAQMATKDSSIIKRYSEEVGQ